MENVCSWGWEVHWRRCADKHMEPGSLGCSEYICNVLGSFFLPLLYVYFPSTFGLLPFFPSSARLLTSLKPQVSSYYTFFAQESLMSRSKNMHANISYFKICREICTVDDSTVICIFSQLPNTEILTVSGESACDGLDLRGGSDYPRSL